MRLATHPCKNCGAPVAPITAEDANGAVYTIHVDPAVPIFYRQSDGEGGVFWSQDRSGEAVARHLCLRGTK